MSLAKLGAGEDRVTHLFYCDASAAHQPNADPIHMAINGALYINVIPLRPPHKCLDDCCCQFLLFRDS